MSISAEMVFSVLIGGLISGLITWLVAHLYFRKQDERAEESFNILARFLENVEAIRSEGGSTAVGFTHDPSGRIRNVNVTVIAGTGEIKVEGHAATVTVTKDTDTRTKGGQNDDLMS
jgi:hypothetical protein